jgi:hypothetical protein
MIAISGGVFVSQRRNGRYEINNTGMALSQFGLKLRFRKVPDEIETTTTDGSTQPDNERTYGAYRACTGCTRCSFLHGYHHTFTAGI